MKATADLPGAPDANSALAGLGTEQVSANRRRFGDGVGGHEHVDLDAVGSLAIGDAHSYPCQSHWSSRIFAQNFNSDSDFRRNWLLHSHLRTDITCSCR